MSERQRYLLDLLERTFATYVEAFLGLLIASGFDVAGTDLAIARKAALAAIPAALAVLKAGAARFKGDPASASLVDVEPEV